MHCVEFFVSLILLPQDVVNGHQPIGAYGNGFKSVSMRLGTDAIVFTKRKDSDVWSVGMLSQTFLKKIDAKVREEERERRRERGEGEERERESEREREREGGRESERVREREMYLCR